MFYRQQFWVTALIFACTAGGAEAYDGHFLVRTHHAEKSRRVPIAELGKIVERKVTFDPQLTLVVNKPDTVPPALKRHFPTNRARYAGEFPVDARDLATMHRFAQAHTHQGLLIGNLLLYTFDMLLGRHQNRLSQPDLVALDSIRQDFHQAFLALHPRTDPRENPNWFQPDAAYHVYPIIKRRVRELLGSRPIYVDAHIFREQPLTSPSHPKATSRPKSECANDIFRTSSLKYVQLCGFSLAADSVIFAG